MTPEASILTINASPRGDDSTTRKLAQAVVEHFKKTNPNETVTVVDRDVSNGLKMVNNEWIAGAFKPADQRTKAEQDALKLSDELIAEVKAADVIVIASPMYNFQVPAALKSWFDQIARAGETFQYTQTGPVGLLEGKRIVFATTSGGTPIDSPVDFGTPYVRHFASFVGITDVAVIGAGAMMMKGEEAQMAAAKREIENLVSIKKVVPVLAAKKDMAEVKPVGLAKSLKKSKGGRFKLSKALSKLFKKQ